MFRKDYSRVTPEFGSETRHAARVLVIDIGGLGDLVHALPAMWAIRQAYPGARLDAVVRQPLAGLLKLTPWIDRVWAYAGRTKSVGSHDLKMARRLRAEGYEVSINLMGTNRSCIIARVSGARWRLGRRPREENRRAWRWLNTHVMEVPYLTEPRYVQKWKCVAQAGITTPAPEFHVADPSRERAALGVGPEDVGHYVHVSPFTSDARRELPPERMAAVLVRLAEAFPGHRLALSCADDARERAALSRLLASLPQPPWKVFGGTLDPAQLFAVISGAALHLSGDTGPMHLAWLASTPTVTWCWESSELAEWLPAGPAHHSIVARGSPREHSLEIDSDAVVGAARAAMARAPGG